jgi:hypothetical protein
MELIQTGEMPRSRSSVATPILIGLGLYRGRQR